MVCCSNLVIKPLFWCLIGFVCTFALLEFLAGVGYFGSNWTNVLKVGPYALDCYSKGNGFQCRYDCNTALMPLSAAGRLIKKIIDLIKS
jgi:hypothetical protein